MTSGTDRSSVSARFRVNDWMAYGVGLESCEDWIAWSRDAKNPRNDTARTVVSLPSMLRRRITTIGQMAFRASCALSEDKTARFIFCTRHGEFQRTLSILKSLAAREPVSPADFSLSVHNALAGLLSIASNNCAGHTTISAGADSFGSAMVDAIACLKSAPLEPVMLVYFDDLLPEPYDAFADEDETCLALAMLLGSPYDDGQDIALVLEPRDRDAHSLSASGQVFDFLRFFLSGERERTSMGERLQWRWQRNA